MTDTTEVLRKARAAIQVAIDSDYGALWHWPETAKAAALTECREAIAAIDEALSTPAAADGEPVTRKPAPPCSLPTWGECSRIIDNYEFRKHGEAGLKGAVLWTPPTTPEPTELHRFIYEYDDADPYRSGWFMHRLELLVKETCTAAYWMPLPPAPGATPGGQEGEGA